MSYLNNFNYQILGQKANPKLVFLHGLMGFGSNWRTMARHFEERYEILLYDQRGHGRSFQPAEYRLDDYADDLDKITAELGWTSFILVGHSLGGLVGYGVAGTETAEKLAGIVTLGSPAFFRYPRYMHRIIRFAMVLGWPRAVRQRLFSVATAPFLGHVALPLTDVVFNPDHIAPREQRKIYAQVVSSVSFGVLKQFDGWLHGDCFCSMDGRVDYRAGMARMNVPLLVTGGSVDRLAPPEVVQSAWELAGSTDKTLMIFGTANGDRLDYGHGDLIFGVDAPTEVFPRIRTWLEARATRRSSTGSG